MYHYYYVVCSRSVARCDYTHFRLMILFVFNWHTHMFNNSCTLLNILHAGRRRTFYVYSGRGSVERCGHLWLWSYRAEGGGVLYYQTYARHDPYIVVTFGSGPTAQKTWDMTPLSRANRWQYFRQEQSWERWVWCWASPEALRVS